MNRINELRRLLGEIRQAMETLNGAGGELSEENQAKWDALVSKGDEYRAELTRLETRDSQLRSMGVSVGETAGRPGTGAPMVNHLPLGDSEERALAHFVRTGDGGGVREQRASNAVNMTIGTDAAGGYAVPTGHYQGIIARRDESMLATQLGVTRIPGKGTTVNVPVDGEADGEFVVTGEGSNHDQDSPNLDNAAMTLLRYTKKVYLTHELMEDEDSRLLDFLANFVGRGMAKTHNNLLLTAVGTNGTAFDTFASNSAIAVGEPENLVSNDDLSNYLDDAGSVGWVMRSTTHWAIKSLTGNGRVYAADPGGQQMQLLGYPVRYSNKAATIGAAAKSVYFGNWSYVGYREAPGFTLLRDPFSWDGGVILKYQFRTVYKVLQAEAIGYGVHP